MVEDAHIISWVNHGRNLWAKRYEWALKNAGPDKQKLALSELSYFVRRHMRITQQVLDHVNRM